ncbi:hypothetical protein MBAV_003668 [Candidatus Magnetobacterium bavaricum]|uniref:Uncharacterized protein n=1 Tax=Candidatus Magnetobacterium bavaricum TaxID=29290 RepID=A0A0F3GQ73_9BACT|nr:hypothetical protein MBAV_003668 [Candidatus Magnetobacterium bavaricum]
MLYFKVKKCKSIVLALSYFKWVTQRKVSDQRERGVESTALPFICFSSKAADIEENMSSFTISGVVNLTHSLYEIAIVFNKSCFGTEK